MKKTGFGAGKYAGFGGAVESGESIEAAAIRELEEETGIKVSINDLYITGCLTFQFPFKPNWSQVVHVFLAKVWLGKPVESDEMKSAWYTIDDIPFNSMWDDASYWLPLILEGKRIKASFTFKDDNETVDVAKIDILNQNSNYSRAFFIVFHLKCLLEMSAINKTCMPLIKLSTAWMIILFSLTACTSRAALTPTNEKKTSTMPAPVPTSTHLPSAEPSIPPSATSTETLLPAQISDETGTKMALIPAGVFRMGRESGSDDEKPVHLVMLDAFYIDVYEVTNAQFAAFLNVQGNQEEGSVAWLASDSWVKITQISGQWQANEGFVDHPVLGMSWFGARAYCTWRGGRLPTEIDRKLTWGLT